jgi:hypothetical protein
MSYGAQTVKNTGNSSSEVVMRFLLSLMLLFGLSSTAPASSNQCFIALESGSTQLAAITNIFPDGSVVDSASCLKEFKEGSFTSGPQSQFTWTFDNLNLRMSRSEVSDTTAALLQIQDLTSLSVSFQGDEATVTASRAQAK